MTSVLVINPEKLRTNSGGISIVSWKPQNFFRDDRVKPIMRLINGDILFARANCNALAASGDAFHQTSLHFAGYTVPGPCFIIGPTGKNGFHQDVSTNGETLRAAIKTTITGRQPRPLNDHLFDRGISYGTGGITRVLPEEASNFAIEETRFPYATVLPPGSRGVEIWVTGKGYDPNAVLGYDEGLDSHFLQSGLISDDEDDERPLIWLGTRPRQFSTINQVLMFLKLSGGYLLADGWRP